MRPSGYTLLRRGSVRALVRHDMVTRLGAWLVAAEIAPLPDAHPIASGRGGAFRARLENGAGIVVRPCRRGGLLGRVLGTIYFGWRPRPWRELAVSVAARARDVPTPAIVAVRVAGWGLYRGMVVTDEAADTMTLADALRASPASEDRARLARTAGEAVGRLHAAGVQHADLNLHNVLVPTRDGNAAGPLVIDLDKARLRSAPLGDAARQQNLRRLRRSWHRIMDGQPVPPNVEAAFRAGYEIASGASCAC
jgi:3-deoxy-D-manno-octulosonic acid kinase